MTYFYVRLFRAELTRMVMISLDNASPEDAIWTRIFAYTGYLTIFCNIPYLVVNLVSGLGVFIPAPAHFGAYVILYSSTLLLCVFYIFTVRSQRGYNKECCWLLTKKDGPPNFMSEIHQRLLRASSNQSTPSGSPRTTANRIRGPAATTMAPDTVETEL